MKTKETIISLTGVRARHHELSIIQKDNLEKMGFNVIEIGSTTKGFDWQDISKIGIYTQEADTVNILINAHGVIDYSYNDQFKIAMSDSLVSSISGRIVLDEINKAVNPRGEDAKKINIILSSCHGEGVHSNMVNQCYDHLTSLPIGSKIITLSNTEASTVESDLFSNKIDLLTTLAKENELQFIDLIKLYSITKRASENVPVVGMVTKEGYKIISLEQTEQSLVKKPNNELKFSKFLEDVFLHNILDRDIMIKVIEKARSNLDEKSLKLPNDFGKMALESINQGTKAEFIKKLSEEYFSGQNLDCISFSELELRNNNLKSSSTITELNLILDKYPLLGKQEQNLLSSNINYRDVYSSLIESSNIKDLVSFLNDTSIFTDINADKFFSNIPHHFGLILKVFEEISILRLLKELQTTEEDNINRIISKCTSPFALESQIIKDTDNFSSFSDDNILSDHGYLIVLGADNLEQYISEI